jgi:hypothetical protein
VQQPLCCDAYLAQTGDGGRPRGGWAAARPPKPRRRPRSRPDRSSAARRWFRSW